MLPALFAEAMGTFIFFSCILFYGAEDAWAVAVGLLAAIYAVGKASDGHFNGTLSLLRYVQGGLTLSQLLGYLIAQFSGALAAMAWYNIAGAKGKAASRKNAN